MQDVRYGRQVTARTNRGEHVVGPPIGIQKNMTNIGQIVPPSGRGGGTQGVDTDVDVAASRLRVIEPRVQAITERELDRDDSLPSKASLDVFDEHRDPVH